MKTCHWFERRMENLFSPVFRDERQVADASLSLLIRPTVRATPDTIDFFKTRSPVRLMINKHLQLGFYLRNLLLLTGGPRTVHVFIVAMLAAHLQVNPDMRIALAAPTGKAAFE